MKPKIIAFDADDTLWVNEPYFRDYEKQFAELLRCYFPENIIAEEFFKTEIANLDLYGYGAKGFMLSMIETAIRVSEGKVSNEVINKIIVLGKSLIDMPVELIDGVENVLMELKNNYRIVLATKGDLLDQERKLRKSGLMKHFHHIEIMSDKKEKDYSDLINRMDIEPSEFMMVGNSLKSDIIPVLNLGGSGIYIPFHTTWQFEIIDDSAIKNLEFHTVNSLSEVLGIL
jgi:putative hydrolase of the HAD superfamily